MADDTTVIVSDKPTVSIAAPLAPAAPVTPGWKTTEFYKGLIAMALIALLASGVIPTTGLGAQITAAAGIVVTFLGYGAFRMMIKTGGAP